MAKPEASMPEVHELPVPPDALEHGGVEVLRALVVDNGLSVTLQRAFETPNIWGMLLVDVARHAARIFAKETELTEEQVLAEIRQMFNAELDRTTDPGKTNAIN